MRLIILLVALISLVSSLDLKIEESGSSRKAKWGSWKKKPTWTKKPWPRRKKIRPPRKGYKKPIWKGYKKIKPWYKGATVKTIFAGVVTTASAHFLVNKYFNGNVERYSNCASDYQCNEKIENAKITQEEYDRIDRINRSLAK